MAAITKYHKLGDLIETYCLTSLEKFWKSKIMVLSEQSFIQLKLPEQDPSGLFQHLAAPGFPWFVVALLQTLFILSLRCIPVIFVYSHGHPSGLGIHPTLMSPHLHLNNYICKKKKSISKSDHILIYWMLEHPHVYCGDGCVLQLLSSAQFFANSWAVVHQPLLSMGFFRQEYWSVGHHSIHKT